MKRLDCPPWGFVTTFNHLFCSQVAGAPVTEQIKLLDTVALLTDLPQASLRRGHVGTVVEALAPGVWEVEFSDDDGQSFACLSVKDADVLVLVHEARPRAS